VAAECDTPKGFIGKIDYVSIEGAGSKPQSLPTAQGVAPPIGSLPTVSSPTIIPTRPKCRPGRPCLTQPGDIGPINSATIMPTISPTKLIQTIVYIENTPARALNEREISKYIEVIARFLDQSTSLEKNDVTIMNITVFNNDWIEEKKKYAGQSGNLRKNGLLPNDINTTDSYAYYHNEEGSYIPKIYPAMFVQTTFEVMTNLPYDVAAFYVWNVFRTNEEELKTLFHDDSLFVSYFREITNLTVQVVDELIVPTASPTKFIENSTLVEAENSAQLDRRNIWLYLGITICVVWLVLTCSAVRHIFRYRRRQRYRQDLRMLTTQEYSSSDTRNIERTSSKTVFKQSSFAMKRSKHREEDCGEDSSRSDDNSLKSFD